MIIAIFILRGLAIHQIDLKRSFLNGDLDEKIYMEQHEGFINLGQEKKVCKLVKSLCGLKQALKQLHGKFDSTCYQMGLK